MTIEPQILECIKETVSTVDKMDVSTIEKVMILESAQGVLRAQLSAESLAAVMSSAFKKT